MIAAISSYTGDGVIFTVDTPLDLVDNNTADGVCTPGSCSLRATHIQPPPKKCRCSQPNTAGSVYAARGSIRLSPNGRSASSSSPRSSGAGGIAVPDRTRKS